MVDKEMEVALSMTHTQCDAAINSKTSDPVQQWLARQWDAAFNTLPLLAAEDAHTTRSLIAHMGYIALTWERLGFPEHWAFTLSAHHILVKHQEIFGVTLEPKDEEEIAPAFKGTLQ